MPKLPKNKAKSVAENEGSSFKPLEEGIYIGTLKDVSVEEGKSDPYWGFEFEGITGFSGDDVELGKTYPGRQWVNVSLGETSEWKMKEVFDAFGYATDSDTDEMVGERVKLLVSQRIAEQGKRKGELVNNVDRVTAFSEEDEELLKDF